MTPAERNLLVTIANVMRVQMQGVINNMAAQGQGIPPSLNEQYRNILMAMNQLETEDESLKHDPLVSSAEVHPFPAGGPTDAA